MISFFPEAYPDELLYSRICRYHIRSGNFRQVFSCRDLYVAHQTRPSFEFLNEFKEDAREWICQGSNLEKVIFTQTMFPAYARYLPVERRNRALQGLINSEGKWSNYLAVPQTGERFIRYCPCCATEDREKYGEAYWHRNHQVQRIRICPKHRCFLKDTSIRLATTDLCGLRDGESAIPQNEMPVSCTNQTEINLADYVLSVFQQPVDMENETPVGYYLHTKLGKYCSERGLARDIDLLFADYSAFFGDVSVADRTNLQKTLNGYQHDNYYVLTLSFFLGISVKEMVHIPKKLSLYGIDKLYADLADKYQINFQTVQNLGSEILRFARQNTYLQRKSGMRVIEWGELDDKNYPLVKKVVDDLYQVQGKPQKLSCLYVERQLGLNSKQLKQLPKCYEYTQKHIETQPQYWARCITWVYQRKIEEKGRCTLSDIVTTLHIRREDIRRALPWLTENLQGLISNILFL